MPTLRIELELPERIVEQIDDTATALGVSREIVISTILRKSLAPNEDDIDDLEPKPTE